MLKTLQDLENLNLDWLVEDEELATLKPTHKKIKTIINKIKHGTDNNSYENNHFYEMENIINNIHTPKFESIPSEKIHTANSGINFKTVNNINQSMHIISPIHYAKFNPTSDKRHSYHQDSLLDLEGSTNPLYSPGNFKLYVHNDIINHDKPIHDLDEHSRSIHFINSKGDYDRHIASTEEISKIREEHKKDLDNHKITKPNFKIKDDENAYYANHNIISALPYHIIKKADPSAAATASLESQGITKKIKDTKVKLLDSLENNLHSHYKEYIKNSPYDQQHSVKHYAGGSYDLNSSLINAYYNTKASSTPIRKYNPEKYIDDYKHHIENIDQFIENSPKLKHPLHVFSAPGKDFKIHEHLKNGDVLHTPAFTSGTIRYGMAEKWKENPHLLHFHLPKGYNNGVYIGENANKSGFMLGLGGENEFLLGRNQYWKHIGTSQINNKYVHSLIPAKHEEILNSDIHAEYYKRDLKLAQNKIKFKKLEGTYSHPNIPNKENYITAYNKEFLNNIEKIGMHGGYTPTEKYSKILSEKNKFYKNSKEYEYYLSWLNHIHKTSGVGKYHSKSYDMEYQPKLEPEHENHEMIKHVQSIGENNDLTHIQKASAIHNIMNTHKNDEELFHHSKNWLYHIKNNQYKEESEKPYQQPTKESHINTEIYDTLYSVLNDHTSKKNKFEYLKFMPSNYNNNENEKRLFDQYKINWLHHLEYNDVKEKEKENVANIPVKMSDEPSWYETKMFHMLHNEAPQNNYKKKNIIDSFKYDNNNSKEFQDKISQLEKHYNNKLSNTYENFGEPKLPENDEDSKLIHNYGKNIMKRLNITSGDIKYNSSYQNLNAFSIGVHKRKSYGQHAKAWLDYIHANHPAFEKENKINNELPKISKPTIEKSSPYSTKLVHNWGEKADFYKSKDEMHKSSEYNDLLSYAKNNPKIKAGKHAQTWINYLHQKHNSVEEVSNNHVEDHSVEPKIPENLPNGDAVSVNEVHKWGLKVKNNVTTGAMKPEHFKSALKTFADVVDDKTKNPVNMHFYAKKWLNHLDYIEKSKPQTLGDLLNLAKSNLKKLNKSEPSEPKLPENYKAGEKIIHDYGKKIISGKDTLKSDLYNYIKAVTKFKPHETDYPEHIEHAKKWLNYIDAKLPHLSKEKVPQNHE
jgi:hypothetical protein